MEPVWLTWSESMALENQAYSNLPSITWVTASSSLVASSTSTWNITSHSTLSKISWNRLSSNHWTYSKVTFSSRFKLQKTKNSLKSRPNTSDRKTSSLFLRRNSIRKSRTKSTDSFSAWTMWKTWSSTVRTDWRTFSRRWVLSAPS